MRTHSLDILALTANGGSQWVISEGGCTYGMSLKRIWYHTPR